MGQNVDDGDPLEGERPAEEAGRERSLASDIEPEDAVPEGAPASGSDGPPGPDPDRVIEEKGRDDRAD